MMKDINSLMDFDKYCTEYFTVYIHRTVSFSCALEMNWIHPQL